MTIRTCAHARVGVMTDRLASFRDVRPRFGLCVCVRQTVRSERRARMFRTRALSQPQRSGGDNDIDDGFWRSR